MPVPYAVARLNRRFGNRVLAVPAPWLPPLAVLHHVGRRTGRRLATPLLAFRIPGGFVVALTYGPQVDWLRNVTAAGGGRLVRAGALHALDAPRRVDGAEGRRLVPAAVRPALRALRVDAFVTFRATRSVTSRA